jgi:DNA-binding NarL/FixJ family response regulator
MSQTNVAACPDAEPKVANRGVALIVDDGPSDRIEATLRKQAFAVDVFDRVEELSPDAGHRRFSVIVLWARNTVSAPTELIGPLAQRSVDTPIVLVCTDIDRWGVRAALAAGAAGIVLADDITLTLGPCLQAVQTGQACVPREHWRQIEPPSLSSREKQILGLVVMGYMNRQIAARLFLAESTVKSHLSSAFGKLGVRSRHDVVSLILDPERGLGLGILTLGGEPMDSAPAMLQ